MCIEDYIKGLKNPVEFQTTSIQPVKCKLSYDISDVATKTAVKISNISQASTQVSYLTLIKGLPLQKSNHVDQAITQGGITCACCLSANFECNKCVLFIKYRFHGDLSSFGIWQLNIK